MAFRTNKVPAIEERTVSGSSVSFNSAFALPLKACKVSFSASQSGSGTPSPQNVRPIIPVSSVDLLANSVSVIVPLGDSYGGGTLDLLKGKAEITYVLSLIKDSNLQYDSSSNTFFVYTTDKAYGILNIISEVLDTVNASVSSMPNYSIKGGSNNRVIYIKATDYTDVASLKTAIGDYRIRYELETPIELSLTPTQLSSVVGNNTFSTDTGTLEITFADLQEKSASGAVASFNTALAMPLVECKTEFMCTQEAGTPSPSNPLAITGVDSAGIQQTGGNIWDEETDLGRWNGSAWVYANNQLKTKNYIPVLPNHVYRLVNPSGTASRYVFYDKNKQYISDTVANSNTTFVTPKNAYYMMYGMATYYGTTYNHNVSINISSSDTEYHAYKANTVTLIDLDGTRYGGYVDVVENKLVITNVLYEPTINDAITGQLRNTYNCWCFTINSAETIYKRDGKAISNINTVKRYSNTDNSGFCTIGSLKPIFALSDSDTGLSSSSSISEITEAFKTFISTYNPKCVYEVTTPIEISLSDIPTISTIIGNNSFASDSGSIELKYKDLDIAKRGNFREVFRLPS